MQHRFPLNFSKETIFKTPETLFIEKQAASEFFVQNCMHAYSNDLLLSAVKKKFSKFKRRQKQVKVREDAGYFCALSCQCWIKGPQTGSRNIHLLQEQSGRSGLLQAGDIRVSGMTSVNSGRFSVTSLRQITSTVSP